MSTEEKVNQLRLITSGKLSATEAKKLIIETEYLRPGNTGDKWSGLYGPFRFWFSCDKYRKVRLKWDSNATPESIQVWKQIGQELYGARFVTDP